MSSAMVSPPSSWECRSHALCLCERLRRHFPPASLPESMPDICILLSQSLLEEPALNVSRVPPWVSPVLILCPREACSRWIGWSQANTDSPSIQQTSAGITRSAFSFLMDYGILGCCPSWALTGLWLATTVQAQMSHLNQGPGIPRFYTGGIRIKGQVSRRRSRATSS